MSEHSRADSPVSDSQHAMNAAQSEGVYSFGLSEILSEKQMVAFTEAFGGTRLYLPLKLNEDHPVVIALGQDAARNLIKTIGHGTLRVPVARDLRARHYRAQGLSHAKIAIRLGMSEVGVGRMFKRLEKQPRP